jgi:hypothetical protein
MGTFMNLKKNYLRRRTIRQALFMTILAGSFQGLFAQETVNKKIEGGQICPQAVVEIQDNKYTFLATGTQPPDFNHYDISDRVILSINHDDPMMNSDFSLNLIISIKPVDENLKPLPVIRPPALHIEYHPTSASYPDNVVFAFTKALKFTVSIDTVKDDLGNILPVAPSNVKLECEISTTRCYDFKFNSKVADVNLRSRYIAATGELEVYWFPAPGAEKYDLEWLYVDDANQTDQSPLSYSFRNNATRVTVAGNFYRIPLVYSTGYLLYNVRPVGRNYPDYTTELYGAWTNDNTITGLVSNYPSSCQYRILKTFDLNPSMNWQTVTTFAEEGKQKTVTSFFCGILLNRQMVTRNNSDYRTLVDETLYDYNNRPAVHVLPAPTPWPKIEYFPLFNRNQSDHHYNKDDFDIDIPGTCDLQVNPMSSIRKSTPVGKPPQTGAAWYYSPNNDDKDGFQAFVPDAENYPFTQVEFEPDNTGRIRRQGGAGPDFKIGSGHETKYFYGQPFQEKLDRNFGSEVGYATHYKMNMVVDANRQINVSYLDSKNRVIATALAGDNPKVDPNDPTFTLLDTIPGYSNGLKEMMINLMNVNDTLPGSLEIKTPIMVTTAGNYDFRYVVQGAGYEFKCDMRKICYDCVYDLTIGLQDACAKEMFSYPVTDSVIGDVPGTDIMADTTCNSEKSRYDSEKNPTGEQLSVYLEPGSYMLIKTLTINDKALNYYTSRFIKDNACLLTFNAFQDSTSKKIDTTDCSITCETCFASLGNRADYVGTGPDSAVLAKEWDELTAECMELCDGYESPCEIAYQMMCSDVSPGGQYGV